MDDLISRQSAIDALVTPRVLDVYDSYWNGRNTQHQEDIDAINALPPAQPKITVDGYADGFADGYKQGLKDAQPERKTGWIPCSERLPEDDELMLVQYVSRPDEGDIWIGWHEMENVWYIDGSPHSKDLGNEVVAWMPLPEPWKEGYDED